MVKFAPGYAAYEKHKGNSVRAFWAVPNAPETRKALRDLGQIVEKKVRE